MERFYDGDQEKLFSEAHVVSPFKTPSKSQKVSLCHLVLYLSVLFIQYALFMSCLALIRFLYQC